MKQFAQTWQWYGFSSVRVFWCKDCLSNLFSHLTTKCILICISFSVFTHYVMSWFLGGFVHEKNSRFCSMKDSPRRETLHKPCLVMNFLLTERKKLLNHQNIRGFLQNSRNLSEKNGALLGKFTIGGFYYIKKVGNPRMVH